jgi:hypothetical protein
LKAFFQTIPKPFFMRFIFLLLLLPALGARAQQAVMELVHFATASSVLSENEKSKLDKLVQSMEGKKITSVSVFGHTDNAGSIEYNQQLSEQRARTVSAYLESKLNVKINIAFKGETAPVAINQNENGKQLNRRTEIMITFATPAPAPPPMEVQPFREEKELQLFSATINNDTIRIYAKEDSWLKIPPGSLRYKDGRAATGEIQVLIREYLNVGDMMMAGMYTEYEEGLLETRGTIDFQLKQGNDSLYINPAIPVIVRIPTNNPKNGMQVFASAGFDSSWKNTNTAFKLYINGWQWPVQTDKRINYAPAETRIAEKLKPGKTFTETMRYAAGRGWRSRFRATNFVKRADITYTRVDENTIKVSSKLSLRSAAKRKGLVASRKVDSTFQVFYLSSEYIAPVTQYGFCNVDTYVKLKKKSYRVSVPGYTGGRLAAIPSIFPTVVSAKEIKPGVYEVTVPEQYSFTLVYMAEKGSARYFGTTNVTSNPKETAVVEVKEVSKEDMKKYFASVI